MSANHLWEDFVFSHICEVPIQLTGEWQPFLSAEHVPSSGLLVGLRVGSVVNYRLVSCVCKLKRNRSILRSRQSRQYSGSTLERCHFLSLDLEARRPWSRAGEGDETVTVQPIPRASGSIHANSCGYTDNRISLGEGDQCDSGLPVERFTGWQRRIL